MFELNEKSTKRWYPRLSSYAPASEPLARGRRGDRHRWPIIRAARPTASQNQTDPILLGGAEAMHFHWVTNRSAAAVTESTTPRSLSEGRG